MNTILMKKRDPIVCVLLSIITGGIYFLFWVSRMIRATRNLEGKEGWVLETLLYLLIPIYPIYWAYNRCAKLFAIAETQGVYIDRNNKNWYAVMALFFGKWLIVYLNQYKINKFADAINGEDAFFGSIDDLMFKLIPDCDIMFMQLYRIITILTIVMIFNVIFYNLILVYLGKHPNVCKEQAIYQVAPQYPVATPQETPTVEAIDETIPEI